MRFIPALILCALAATRAADFPAPYNSGNDKDAKPPMTGEEAVKSIKLPPGFKATLFAAEPDVQNPIACAWDSRGRLWVAENYTYAESAKTFDHSLRDRILIFEDTDNDGRHDKRTVFADNLTNLTSIELGYGGVYATAAPHLLFIPDKNGDDRPDAEAEILLDGFDAWSIRHNFVNGLKWGPDGWLYGRHGIQATSNVGRPGAPDSERVKINCCIWRFHPVRKAFEVVCWGGTNPWGHDWNAEGEGFFTNTVTGHLYHIIPGAHYERMYGEDLNPHIYQLLPQTADHYHYDTSKHWTDSRDGKANDFGGGHAHTGCMIYQGENWPEQYRGKLFTINLHGRRLNVERLERKGSGYTAKHDGDLFQFSDPWFRGVELTYGPDGGVYILDWSDQGECHENDGVHRTSGRIYKITYGEVKNPVLALDALADYELARIALAGSEWESRVALRKFVERNYGRKDLPEILVKGGILSRVKPKHPLGLIRIMRAVGQTEPYPRITPEAVSAMAFVAKEGPAVRLAMCREAFGRSIEVLLAGMEVLLSAQDDNADPLLPIYYWHVFEPAFGGRDPDATKRAVTLAYNGSIHSVQKFAARRAASDLGKDPAALNTLLGVATENFDPVKAANVVIGIAEALSGVSRSAKPTNWDAFVARIGSEPSIAAHTRRLNAIFGDGRALDEIRDLALEPKTDLPSRRQALETLITSKSPDLRAVCEKLIGSRDLAHIAIRGLATFDDANAAKLAIANWDNVRWEAHATVISDFATRPVFARALLDAVATGKIDREEITPYHARQIAALNDPAISAQLAKVWGEVRATPETKRKRIAELKQALTADTLAKANLDKGRDVFSQTCATCHRLFDLGQSGTQLGPNLTGAGRENLDYLLENIVDPNALVPQDYKLSIVTMKDGRTLSGFISMLNEQTLTLRTMTDTQNFAKADVAKTETSPNSLMPEGLLDTLSAEQVRDLFGFLMKK